MTTATKDGERGEGWTHTLTPWHDKPNIRMPNIRMMEHQKGRCLFSPQRKDDGSDYSPIATFQNVEDAAFALKAVNSHDALVEALEELIERAAYDLKMNQDREDGGWWTPKTVEAISSARAALARARGTP